MFRMALRTLRFRKLSFAAVFIAVFFGAAMVMACGGLMETGIRTAVPPQQLSGDIVVAGDQEYEMPTSGDDQEIAILSERVRLDDRLVDAIAGLPGVQAAQGHVLDGRTVPDMVDAITVTVSSGSDVDDVRKRIDAEIGNTDAVTLVGDDRGLAELPQAKASSVDLISLAGVFGGTAIMVAVFGVASMLALSIQQRQKEMALLRAVGTTPRQLRRMVLGETLVLSLIATALAYIPGTQLGRFLFERMTAAGVVPDGVVFHQGWIPTVAAIGAGVIAALGGALVAGRRAGKVRPAQAVAEASVDRQRLSKIRIVFAVLFLGGGFALSIVTMNVLSGSLALSTAGPAVMLWAIGVALLSPVLTRGMAVLIGGPLRLLTGLSGKLAMLNVKANSARMASAIAPIILLTGFASAQMYLQSTEARASEQDFANSLVADAVLTSTDHAIEPGTVDRLNRLEGVAGASAWVVSSGFVEDPHDPSQDDDGWSLQGVTAEGAAATTPVTTSSGDLADLHGESVALPASYARKLGIGVGDTMTVRLGDNTAVDLDVVATFEATGDFHTLLMPADLLAAHTTEGHVTEVLVKAEPGNADLTALLQEVADEQGLTMTDREAMFATYAEQQETARFANYTLVAMVIVYSTLTVINTLVSSTTSRRREFGLLRLAGSTRRQVMSMVATEGVLVALIGIVLGTVVSIATVTPFSVTRMDSLTPSGSPLVYVAVVVVGVGLTLGASLLSGWRMLRARPAAAAVAVQ
jgi:putative ABC transport system permease protein